MQPKITVNIQETRGEVRSIHGVNMGPLCQNGAVDNSDYFKDIKFPTVRLHDCPAFYDRVVDIPAIFPLYHLDHNDPNNYLFGRTDHYIKSILDCGCRIVYRLGVSIEGDPEVKFDTDPPADYRKWAEICCNIIRHYNYGWADGFHYDIKYWEIWNEPDNGPSQWNAGFEEFIRFYTLVSSHLKNRFPELLIGGPALNGAMREEPRKKLDEFLPQVKKFGSPLDFLTWHAYPLAPGELTHAAAVVRETLDAYGFTETESHLNEWNMGPPGNDWKRMRYDKQAKRTYFEDMHSSSGSALTASCLIALQEAPVDMTNYYTAGTARRGFFDFTGLPLKPFFAFKAFRMLIRSKIKRYSVNGGNPDKGLAVLAGISEQHDRLYLLLSNFNSENRKWQIRFEGIPMPEKVSTHYVLDGNRDLEPETEKVIEWDDHTLSVEIPKHTVRLIQFSVI